MKKTYVSPEMELVVVANEDVMNTSPIITPWLPTDSALNPDEL